MNRKTSPPSRRSLLRALGGGAVLGALAGCGVPAAYVGPGDRAGADLSATDKRLTWANWPLYIDTDDEDSTRRPTLEAFGKRTGISVDYVEEINDNDEFFGKISPSLMNHQRTGRDLIVISDWMCARFVRLGWVQEMDRSRQPNVVKYLDPLLSSPAFDPGRKSSVPWQSGITGIAYNRRRVGREIRHVSDLWADDLHSKNHHQQYSDLLKSTMHRNDRRLTICSDCHGSHGEAPNTHHLFADPLDPDSLLCQTCHAIDIVSHMTSMFGSAMAGPSTLCTRCHMPLVAQNGAGKYGLLLGAPMNVPADDQITYYENDLASHLFLVPHKNHPSVAFQTPAFAMPIPYTNSCGGPCHFPSTIPDKK